MDYCNSVESTNYLSSAILICLIKLFYQYYCMVQKFEVSKILILLKEFICIFVDLFDILNNPLQIVWYMVS